MSRISILSIFVLLCAQAHSENGVNFEHGKSWAEIRQKAQDEHKYIFLDCIATWCGPCKEMDLQVYSSNKISAYINSHFISVKVQMDTTTSDGEEVRHWYQTANAIRMENNVNSFPTFLLFSPDGKMVHKGIGFMDSTRFIKFMEKALDPSEQIYTLVAEFSTRKLAFSKMPELSRSLERIGEKELAKKVVSYYIEKYLLQLNERDLYTEKTLRYIGSHIYDTKGPIFTWFYCHSSRIDSTIFKGFAEKILDNFISLEEVLPTLMLWDSSKSKIAKKEDWAPMYSEVQKKYGTEYANRIILDGQIRWYSYKQQWPDAIATNLQKIETYGLDTTSLKVASTNDMLYSTIFKHCEDKGTLKKAIQWMTIICKAYPDEPDYLDTYANLYYKVGKRKKAIYLEEKAVHLNSRNDEEINANMQKMKHGLPTWQ